MAEQPTDVRSVLQGSQDVLDAAVATVTATRKTQNVLEQNIYHTKEKIDEVYNTIDVLANTLKEVINEN